MNVDRNMLNRVRMVPPGYEGHANPMQYVSMPGPMTFVAPHGCITTSTAQRPPQINPRTGLGEYTCLAAAMAIRKQLAENPAHAGLRDRQRIIHSAQHAIEVAKIRAAARPTPHLVVGGDPTAEGTPALACDPATCPTMLAKRSRRGQTPGTKCPTKVCRLHHFVEHVIWCKCPTCEPRSLMYVRQKSIVLRENWSMKGVKDLGCAAVLKRFKYEVMMGKLRGVHNYGSAAPAAQIVVGPSDMTVVATPMLQHAEYAAAQPRQYCSGTYWTTPPAAARRPWMQRMMQQPQYVLVQPQQQGVVQSMPVAQGAQLMHAPMIQQQYGGGQQQQQQQQQQAGAKMLMLGGDSMMQHQSTLQQPTRVAPLLMVQPEAERVLGSACGRAVPSGKGGSPSMRAASGATMQVSLFYLPLHFV